MMEELLLDLEERMEKAILSLRTDLLGVRTGRASPALVERIQVEAYGATMPLNQMATIAVPEARLLTIRPWDANNVSAITRALMKSDLGLTPNSDGRIIRLPIPPLTDERRRDLARIVSRRTEEARVAVRNIRRDGLREMSAREKAHKISEDEFYASREELQELTDQYVKQADELGEQKQAEIMEV